MEDLHTHTHYYGPAYSGVGRLWLTYCVQVWEDLNQHIRFVDVTEECRSLYGRVQSNCLLLEVGYTYYGCT